MNRRKFIAGIGVGITTASAGCSSFNNSEETESEEDESEEYRYASEDLERMQEDYYDLRVEDEMQIKAHHIHINGIRDISSNQLSLECDVSVNPVDDYEVHLHYNVLDESETGNWITEPKYSKLNTEKEYNESTEEWEIPYNYEKELVYDVGSMDLGEKIDTMTIPSGIFWGEDDSVDMYINNFSEPRMNMLNISEKGCPAILEFDLSDVPMFKTGVFSLSWTDENNKSNRDNELITSTSPVIRVSEEEFIYPEMSKYGHHSHEEAYINNIESEDSTVTGNITRVSNYGLFSDKQDEFEEPGVDDVDVGSTDMQKFLDTPIQFPWNISYTISESEINRAESVVSSEWYDDGQGVKTVYNVLNNDKIMNHDIIKDVASQLGEVCDKINATHPTEQLRVVSDFVQYIPHYDDDKSFFEPVGPVQGTSHPIETLSKGEGDCKDFTLLGNAILQQEPFNMNPDAFVIENTTENEDGESIGHISTSIPVSELGGEEFIEKLNDQVFDSRVDVGLAQNGSERHAYVEMSGAYNIGVAASNSLDYEELQPMSSFV